MLLLLKSQFILDIPLFLLFFSRSLSFLYLALLKSLHICFHVYYEDIFACPVEDMMTVQVNFGVNLIILSSGLRLI